jgi:hypothetical protein
MNEKNPPYRTLFSMASLVISVQAASAAFLLRAFRPGRHVARGDGEAPTMPRACFSL